MAEYEAALKSRAPSGNGLSGRSERALVRRRGIPGGRALVGGFLVSLAAVVTFAAYSSVTTRPRQLYVVAARALPAGTRLSEADLRLAALDLPDQAVRSQVFGTKAQLVGASVLAPIGSGALIEASAVVGRAGPIGTREISISIDRSRAVAGTLKAGEYVDLLGTFGSGADAYTTVMVARLLVISITNVTSSLSDNRTQLITFAAPSEVAAEAIADAGYVAQVTLVRSGEQTSGTAPTDATAPTYRASESSNRTAG